MTRTSIMKRDYALKLFWHFPNWIINGRYIFIYNIPYFLWTCMKCRPYKNLTPVLWKSIVTRWNIWSWPFVNYKAKNLPSLWTKKITPTYHLFLPFLAAFHMFWPKLFYSETTNILMFSINISFFVNNRVVKLFVTKLMYIYFLGMQYCYKGKTS